MIDIKNDECTGCKLCAEVCPVGAIEFKYEIGFSYPRVNNDKCIKCGKCVSICPSLNPIRTDRNKHPDVFAVWTKNTEQRVKCTSGGICFELSKYIIDNGGYVAGVEWDKGFRDAHYTIVNDYEGLQRITQTKYFQVETAGIYSQVKELLDKGETVLYIGTPCTNAALQKYLGKVYDNLYNCEFICRGLPSKLVHIKNLEHIEKQHNSKITYLQSKNKNKGWRSFGSYFEFENGTNYYVNRNDDPMTRLFTWKDMNTRPSCYQCKYRTIPRYSDITVGDFWGIMDVREEDYNNGVSVFMINSDKGQVLFDAVKDKIDYQRRTLFDVKKGNPCLLNNPRKTESCDEFFEDVENMEFGDVLKKYVPKKSIWNDIKRKHKRNMRELKFYLKYDMLKFIYYNFFCKSVVRKKGCFIRPHKGTCIEMDKTAKLYVNAHLVINPSRVKGSKTEAHLVLRKNSVMEINGNTSIGYGSSVTVNQNAHMTMGRTGININTVIVCNNSIDMGNDVMIGRNVMIYDDDFHKKGKARRIKGVTIGNHVWICSNSCVMKNVTIEDGAVVSANSVVINKVKERTMVYGNPAKVVMEDYEWSR